ncbi:MAG: sugar phosphate isomerase/epimerase family protein [Christensenellales bacterium]|jgi:sugar phosphate isomerase/epimerase
MVRNVRFSLAVSQERLGDGAPVPLQGGILPAMERAAALGYDSVELHIRDPHSLDAERIAQTAERLGITVSAIATGLEYSLNGLTMTSPDPAVRQRMRTRYREHIDLAARLGAVVFLGMCRGNAAFADIPALCDLLADEIAPVAQYAREQRVTLALEPIAFYLTRILNTTGETLGFLERPGMQDIGLLLDTHHMFIEDPDVAEAFASCRGRIAHVHISDSNRRYPGAGNVDFAAVGRALIGIGYDRAVSLEVLPWPDGETAARRGLAWMRSVWGDQSAR